MAYRYQEALMTETLNVLHAYRDRAASAEAKEENRKGAKGAKGAKGI
jgi:hypothetical protein